MNLFRIYTKILFLILLSLIFSCSVTKKVPEGSHLLAKNTIYENGKKIWNSDAYESIYQKKQSEINLLPFRLWLYNLSASPLDSILRIWKEDENRTNHSLDSLLIANNQAHWIKKPLWLWFNKQFVENEKEPVILDTTMIQKSEKSILNYYKWKTGHLNAKISSETKLLPLLKEKYNDAEKVAIKQQQLKNKKAQVDYYITLGEQYYLDSLIYDIKDSTIQKIYQKDLSKSELTKGKPYNEDLFTAERDRIVKQLREEGYYDFSSNNVILEADSSLLSNKRIVGIIKIKESYTGDSYNKVYRLKEVNILPNHLAEEGYSLPDSLPVTYRNYKIYYKGTPNYKPRVYSDLILLEKNEKYNQYHDTRSKYNLNRSKNFTIPEIKYIKDSLNDSLLIANVYFNERIKYSFDQGIDIFTSNYLSIGISPSINLLSRNIFGGGENLETNIKLTGGTTSKIDNASGFAFEATSGAKLTIPRFLIPFINTESIFSKGAYPQTDIGITASWQKQIGLGRISLSADYDYSWHVRNKITHKLELGSIQYIRNTNADDYFSLYTSDRAIRDAQYDDYFAYDSSQKPASGNYDEVDNNQMSFIILNDYGFKNSSFYDESVYNDYITMSQRQRRIVENVLISSTAYTFEYDERGVVPRNPFYFRGKIEIAGNLLRLIDKLNSTDNTNENSIIYKNKFLGVGYAQFAKFDIDIRKYWDINKYNVLASRILWGYALPYGNAESVPFNHTYFAGGSGDIRAWTAYSIGPGSISRSSQSFSTDLFKLTLNTEWRHKMSDFIGTAFFVDAGNIWSVSQYADEDAKFKINSFYKQLAIGAGFGLRFNFGFNIVARLDMAYRIHDPNVTQNNWFNDFKIYKPQWNFGIGYPF